MHRLARILLLSIVLGLPACSTSEELTESERALLITEADVRELGLPPASNPGGAYRKTINRFDQSRELTYELQREGVYLASTMKLDSSAIYAFLSGAGQKFGLFIGLRSTGVTEEPLEARATYGDRSSLTLLKKDDRPVGNAFTVVAGKKAFMLAFAGVYFEDAGAFDRSVGAKISGILKMNE